MNTAYFFPLALGIACGSAGAQIRQDEHAAVIDSRGAAVTSGFGLCLRSGFGPTPLWNARCNGELPPAAPAVNRSRGEPQPSVISGRCKDAGNAMNIACMHSGRQAFIEGFGSSIGR